MSAWFFRRPYPNANGVLLAGPRPVLVDTGNGGDVPALLDWVRARGVAPAGLACVVNTHWHTDHSGGNAAMGALGVPVWGEASEAAVVNAWGADACRAEWLRQGIGRYGVARGLRAGEVVDTGARRWRVVELPGHTPTQIGLWDACGRVLVAGDALHEADFGWLDVFADPAAVERQGETLERIAELGPGVVLSGHGPAIEDVPGALARARRRLAGFRDKPERAGWHACKRIFGHALMLEDGLAREAVGAFLLGSPWFRDHAAGVFGVGAEAFVPELVGEMVRSGAARWEGERLVSATPYAALPGG